MSESVLLSLTYNTKNLQFVEHGNVWSNWRKEGNLRVHRKGYSNLSTKVDTRSFVEELVATLYVFKIMDVPKTL